MPLSKDQKRKYYEYAGDKVGSQQDIGGIIEYIIDNPSEFNDLTVDAHFAGKLQQQEINQARALAEKMVEFINKYPAEDFGLTTTK